MASKKVSPKGIVSGIRMIQYFINRAGKALPATRKRELERAKTILKQKRERQVKR
jgi:tRNA(adenine34) deaminase